MVLILGRLPLHEAFEQPANTLRREQAIRELPRPRPSYAEEPGPRAVGPTRDAEHGGDLSVCRSGGRLRNRKIYRCLEERSLTAAAGCTAGCPQGRRREIRTRSSTAATRPRQLQIAARSRIYCAR